jgi:hypothetical protein
LADYDFTGCLSPLDFEVLSKDLIEAALGVQLENFGEGHDKGIDLRFAPLRGAGHTIFNLASFTVQQKPQELIVQCKRYSNYSDLKSVLKNKERIKIQKLNPARYILTTSVSLTPYQVDEIKTILSPFVQSTGDIFGRERLNSLLAKQPEIERRHIKLWVSSAGVLDSIINAGTHIVSKEEVERTLAAAKIYVRNKSFDEALAILKQHRVCIISGLPSIGKTTLARMLMLYFYERRFDVVKITGDISEARAVGYHSKPRFYYYDDFLGQTAQADKLNKNEDQRLLDFMASVRDSKESVFVLTTREYILNQARLHYEKLAREKFDHRTCIIDLSKYSRRIRAQILYNHLYFSKLPKAHLEALVAERGYIKIIDHQNYNPRLIQYLTDLAWIGNIPPSDYRVLFLRKLDNPVEIWDHAFRNQLSDKARHLLFVLTTMPRESLMPDLENAFEAFHLRQCKKFGIAYSTTDYNTALRELDGTFIATRKIREFVLVRFQNPSIRDFMQHLLLGGLLLSELIESLCFFEQAEWFLETLKEEQPQVPTEVLRRHAPNIIKSLRKLFKAVSCTFTVFGDQSRQYIYSQPANPARRLAICMQAIGANCSAHEDLWVEEIVILLATDLENGALAPSVFASPVKALLALNCFSSPVGERLVRALTRRALEQLEDLDDFETLVALVDAMPSSFSALDLTAARQAYARYAEQFAVESDDKSPEEIRDDAERIGSIGGKLQVDTDTEQERLRELAWEIEKEQASNYFEDYEERTADSAGACSDGELDSMFGTLLS